MQGRATAPAAGTILNALATGVGAAFAIDADTVATVTLDPTDAGDAHASGDGARDGVPAEPTEFASARTITVEGTIEGASSADTTLVERCVELAVRRWHDESDLAADRVRGTVRTESEIPMAAGLKSSSAAATAPVRATARAVGVDPDPRAACRLGVAAARDADVTVTGAFDDASASMLGGLTLTDNNEDALLAHDDVDWDVLVWTPPERAFSADADVARCEQIAPLADLVADLTDAGDYGLAMTVNGLAYASALDYPTDPIVDALPAAAGASLSGTGPSYVAIAPTTPDGDDAANTTKHDDAANVTAHDDDAANVTAHDDAAKTTTPLETVASRWRDREGDVWRTRTRSDGARIL